MQLYYTYIQIGIGLLCSKYWFTKYRQNDVICGGDSFEMGNVYRHSELLACIQPEHSQSCIGRYPNGIDSGELKGILGNESPIELQLCTIS